jgi:hypothetical protein
LKKYLIRKLNGIKRRIKMSNTEVVNNNNLNLKGDSRMTNLEVTTKNNKQSSIYSESDLLSLERAEREQKISLPSKSGLNEFDELMQIIVEEHNWKIELAFEDLRRSLNRAHNVMGERLNEVSKIKGVN